MIKTYEEERFENDSAILIRKIAQTPKGTDREVRFELHNRGNNAAHWYGTEAELTDAYRLVGELFGAEPPVSTTGLGSAASPLMHLQAVEARLAENGYTYAMTRPNPFQTRIVVAGGGIVNVYDTGTVTVQGKADDKLRELFER